MDDSDTVSPQYGRNNNYWDRSLTTTPTTTTTTTKQETAAAETMNSKPDTDDDIDGRIYQEELKHLLEPQNRPPIVRSSRGFRHFQNPPQPHMCIRHHTIDGQELFINVMSWTRIVMPQNADEPIPLYGGMRVPPGSPRSPPLVYAVMANPEILKQVGRNCADPEKKLALVELMCDFVEAMNPGLKLARDAEVLKDRDLSGELKDIWGAVQAKREREKEVPPYENYLAAQNQVTYMEFGPDTAFQKQQQQQQNPINTPTSQQLTITPSLSTLSSTPSTTTSSSSALTSFIELAKTSSATVPTSNQCSVMVTQIDGSVMPNGNNSITPKDNSISLTPKKSSQSSPPSNDTAASPPPVSVKKAASSSSVVETASVTVVPKATSTVSTAVTTTATAVKTPPTSTKKEKLGGFLPNGCHNIFPFIKSKSSQKKEKKSNGKNCSSQWKSGSGGGGVSSQPPEIVSNGVHHTAAVGDVIDSNGKNSAQSQDNNSYSGVKDDGCTVDSKMQKLKL